MFGSELLTPLAQSGLSLWNFTQQATGVFLTKCDLILLPAPGYLKLDVSFPGLHDKVSIEYILTAYSVLGQGLTM